MREPPRSGQAHHAFHDPADTHNDGDQQGQRRSRQGRVPDDDNAADGDQSAKEDTQHTPSAGKSFGHDGSGQTDRTGDDEVDAQHHGHCDQGLVRPEQKSQA